MNSNNNGNNRSSESRRRTDSNGVLTETVSEIGYPNNKDKGKEKNGGIVGKE